MSFPKSGRIQRRLLQIAALSLTGLMSGLITGCSSDSVSALSLLLPNHHNSEWQAYSTANATADSPDRLATHADYTTSRRYLETIPTHLRLRNTQHLIVRHP